MYISILPEQIRLFHDIVLDGDGGLAGEKDPGYIDFIAEKPFQESFGHELYPGLFLKAATYMHGIITAHPFFDGNKRTGVLTCLAFLDLNHRPLQCDPDELFLVAIAVATNELDVEQLAAWLERRT